MTQRSSKFKKNKRGHIKKKEEDKTPKPILIKNIA